MAACALTEDDIPGSSLVGREPASLKNEELRFWLKCRGDSLKGLKTKALLVKRSGNILRHSHFADFAHVEFASGLDGKIRTSSREPGVRCLLYEARTLQSIKSQRADEQKLSKRLKAENPRMALAQIMKVESKIFTGVLKNCFDPIYMITLHSLEKTITFE